MKFNKKMGQLTKDGGWKLRVWHRKARGIESPRFLIKCGDCDRSTIVDYGEDDNIITIGGVCSSREEWAKVLSPLLKNVKKRSCSRKQIQRRKE